MMSKHIPLGNMVPEMSFVGSPKGSVNVMNPEEIPHGRIVSKETFDEPPVGRMLVDTP